MATVSPFPDNGSPARRGRTRPVLALALVVLAGLAAWFLFHRIHYLSNFAPPSYGDDYYWPRRWGLLPHLLAGATAISVGLVQLWLGATGQTGALHRRLGRIYVGAICIAAPAGMYMALSIPAAYDHLSYASGLFMLDVAWIVTTGMAVLAIKRRDIAQHRAWMIRSYTVTFAFATYRLLSIWISPYLTFPADPVATEFDRLLAWGCWTVPLLFAEVGISLATMRRG